MTLAQKARRICEIRGEKTYGQSFLEALRTVTRLQRLPTWSPNFIDD
jgi:hypothetical protein